MMAGNPVEQKGGPSKLTDGKRDEQPGKGRSPFAKYVLAGSLVLAGAFGCGSKDKDPPGIPDGGDGGAAGMAGDSATETGGRDTSTGGVDTSTGGAAGDTSTVVDGGEAGDTSIVDTGGNGGDAGVVDTGGYAGDSETETGGDTGTGGDSDTGTGGNTVNGGDAGVIDSDTGGSTSTDSGGETSTDSGGYAGDSETETGGDTGTGGVEVDAGPELCIEATEGSYSGVISKDNAKNVGNYIFLYLGGQDGVAAFSVHCGGIETNASLECPQNEATTFTTPEGKVVTVSPYFVLPNVFQGEIRVDNQ